MIQIKYNNRRFHDKIYRKKSIPQAINLSQLTKLMEKNRQQTKISLKIPPLLAMQRIQQITPKSLRIAHKIVRFKVTLKLQSTTTKWQDTVNSQIVLTRLLRLNLLQQRSSKISLLQKRKLLKLRANHIQRPWFQLMESFLKGKNMNGSHQDCQNALLSYGV